MKIKKALYLSIALAMFASFQAFASSVNINTDDIGDAGLVSNNFDIKEETQNTVSEPEADSLENLTVRDKESESLVSKGINLNIVTVFDNFDIESSDVHNILLTINGELKYEDEEDVTKEFTKINLSKENDFKSSSSFECTDKSFSISPVIPTDYSNAYQISVKYNDEEAYIVSSDVPSYNVIITVHKIDGAITDANKAPELSKDWNKLASGKYSESRAEEIGIDITDKPKNIEEKQDDAFINYIAIGLGLLVVIIIAGTLTVYVLYKKANDDDE